MTAASFALQQAIFAALGADSGVQALIGARLFDAVPRDATFPYAVLGDDAETNWDTATESGSAHVAAIDVWSRGGGHKESKLIADAVRAALDGAALVPPGQTLIGIRYQGADFAREEDGETYRATLHFRAVMEPQ
ncbi:MAG TPA: DUF3168 domain-containing protein [Rhizomicrobium sp.]|jgi:hypothetical protein|nr:DUF3168 domain-containing protein [Rhizomicrobium sp.]